MIGSSPSTRPAGVVVASQARLALLLLVAALPGACRSQRPARRRAVLQAEPAPPTTRTLRLVAWNVLADPVFKAQRVPELLRVLAHANADVIALQEVAPWFLRALHDAPWVRGHYHLSRENGEVIAPGGQLILARFPIERTQWSVLPGSQRRTALYASLRVNARTLAIGTSHLESYLEDGPVRAQQLRVMFTALARAEDAILLGDLNFGDGESPETEALDLHYVDVWRALRPNAPGLTWDMERVPLAQVGAFKTERSRRLDRVLLRSARWRASAVRLLGQDPVGQAPWPGHPPGHDQILGTGKTRPGDVIAVHPSDHLGLQADLVWR